MIQPASRVYHAQPLHRTLEVMAMRPIIRSYHEQPPPTSPQDNNESNNNTNSKTDNSTSNQTQFGTNNLVTAQRHPPLLDKNFNLIDLTAADEIDISNSELDLRVQTEGKFDELFLDNLHLSAHDDAVRSAASAAATRANSEYAPLLQLRQHDRTMHVDREHARKLRNYMMKLAKTRYLCDCILYNGNNAKSGVAVHSLVLRSESDLWNYEVEKRAAQRAPDEQLEIRLRHEVDDACFKAVLRYMYSGKIDINIANVLGMQRAAQALQVPEVLSLSNDFLNLVFAGQNLVTLMSALKLVPGGEDSELMNLARMRITRKMERASKQAGGVFKESALLYSAFEDLRNLMSNPSISAQNELDKLIMALNWLNYSRDRRLHHMPELLGLIDFTRLTEAELVSCWEIDPVFRNEAYAKDMLLKANMKKALMTGDPTSTNTTATGAVGGAGMGSAPPTAPRYPKINLAELFERVSGESSARAEAEKFNTNQQQQVQQQQQHKKYQPPSPMSFAEVMKNKNTVVNA